MKESVIIRLRFEGDSESISRLLQCPNFKPTNQWEAGQKKLPRRNYEFDGVEFHKEHKEKGLPEAGKLVEGFLTSGLLEGYHPEEFRWERSLLSLIYLVRSRPCLFVEGSVVALMHKYAVDFDIDFRCW